MGASSPAAALLRAGVPLSLLLDLAAESGPDSAEILRAEAVAADLDYERSVTADLTRFAAAQLRWHANSGTAG